MDYESTTDDLLIFSMIFNHPLISLPIIILAIFFAFKACSQHEECAEMNCKTGSPMIVKGECLCVQKAE